MKHKTRPTEYKGTVYRSKSEAMFARFLELDGQSYIRQPILVYEPEFFTLDDGYCPDFLRQFFSQNHYGIYDPVWDVIEYKPSRPTNEYIREWAHRCFLMFNKVVDLCGHYRLLDVQFRIAFGSVWNEKRGVVTLSNTASTEQMQNIGHQVIASGVYLEEYDWIAPFENEIRSTRFDLEVVQ